MDKSCVSIIRCSLGYYQQADRNTYDVVSVDNRYAVVYQTSFMDVGHELILHVSQKQSDAEVVDMYQISCAVSASTNLLKQIRQFHKGAEYCFEQVLIDEFNEGDTVRISVTEEEIIIEGRADHTVALRTSDVFVVDVAGGIQLRHNERIF